MEIERKITKVIREHPTATAVVLIVISVACSIVAFGWLGDQRASLLGDAFGIAAALLAGGALLAIAASLHDINDNQLQQQKQIDGLASIARAIIDQIVVARVEL